jgi:hypothetical protein
MRGGIHLLQRRFVAAVALLGLTMVLLAWAFAPSADAGYVELPSSPIVGPSPSCSGGPWSVSWRLQNQDARPVEVRVTIDGVAVAFTPNPVAPGQTATATRQFPAAGFHGDLTQSVWFVGEQGGVSTSRLDLPACSLPTTTTPRPTPRPPVVIDTVAPAPVPVSRATTTTPGPPPAAPASTTTTTAPTTTTAAAVETTTTAPETTTSEPVPGTAVEAASGTVPDTMLATAPSGTAAPAPVDLAAAPVSKRGTGPWLWIGAAVVVVGIVAAGVFRLRRRA